MSRRILILFVLSILVVALSGAAMADPAFEIEPLKTDWDLPTENRPPGDDEGDDSMEFGKEIAGAWLGQGGFTLDLDCDGYADDPNAEPWPFPYDLQSFGVGGEYYATNPNNPNLGHGSWKKTGRREVTTSNIVIENDANGELLWVMQIPGVFSFDQDFETATSTFGAIGYLPGQDPLDPDEVPAWCTVGTHTLLQKVTVEP